ncbi:unnamed protein product [Didymodactylos carnosus]|uniref:Uncharacterized protein n=1 Tax=Didymodactylos carnosus TaxID=1234261 RepID=A0A814E6S7_9BILA|nr:unnamed protein product [Didymodactylos carnosus]CAF1167733.1 unnamed protein product [Didymodactylos carnosus]CAF3737661.1 unnamed protein product [Didymodactylos carnosus]CAF3979203.1 unnamed protein product [Didymodactylos carnosus]
MAPLPKQNLVVSWPASGSVNIVRISYLKNTSGRIIISKDYTFMFEEREKVTRKIMYQGKYDYELQSTLNIKHAKKKTSADKQQSATLNKTNEKASITSTTITLSNMKDDILPKAQKEIDALNGNVVKARS